MVESCLINTPLGDMLAATEDNALVGLWFTGQKYFPKEAHLFVENPATPVFRMLMDYLGAYFSGEKPGMPTFRTNPSGTPFQKEVWELVSKVPYGKTATYGALALEIAKLRGTSALMAQAVGSAVGHNPLSLVVPCHRILGANGQLTGYAAGTPIKKKLLEMEGVRVMD